jgi:hypothetical protein
MTAVLAAGGYISLHGPGVRRPRHQRPRWGRARAAGRTGAGGRWTGHGRRARLSWPRSPSTPTPPPTRRRSRLASRRPGERWLCLEQPERDAAALAALGSACTIETSGPERFRTVAAEWRRVAATAVVDDPAGLVAAGGFAFAPDGGGSPAWQGFAAASLTVGEATLVRTWRVRPADAGHARRPRRHGGGRGRPRRQAHGRAALAAAGAARPRPGQPLADRQRDAPRALRGRGRRAPSSASARASSRRSCWRREVEVHAGAAHDPAAVLGVLREAFPGCYVFGVGRGDAAFVAASPELLVRREGQRASTLALAGLHPPQRRSGGRRSPRRAAAAQRQGPGGAGDRGAAHRAHARPTGPVAHRSRGARARANGEHPASRHPDPRPAGGSDRRG